MTNTEQGAENMSEITYNVHSERVRHSGALVVSAFVDDGGGEFLHSVTYYWESEDGDPREDFVRTVLDSGWRFTD